MKDARGSVWRKWDLQVHTPDSLINQYGGSDPWARFIEALSKLPPEFKVLGINDYIFLDGYKKVVAAQTAGKLPNIDLILPVIELRLDKFGGSKSNLSRVNYHIIFSNEIAPEIIESQFISALSSEYMLSPQYEALRTTGRWAAVPTRTSLEDLGREIIASVPEQEKVKFGAPLVEGFNNLCVNLASIQKILKRPYFDGKVLTAVGKTEWADIKWNDQSIADKKTIINSADLVLIAAESPEGWRTAQNALADAGVNARLLDCSDAHQYADGVEKDRLENCFTWIKSDPTFEGLRQAVLEYPTRVAITKDKPLEPLLQLKRVFLDFPSETALLRDESSNEFCFRGRHELTLSPYLTCIVGGRGAGKSTLLNLIHEKLEPRSTEFFKTNRLHPAEAAVDRCVRLEGVAETGVIEFLQQNEVEQFASDHKRLTTAVFSRLRKLQGRDVLTEKDVMLEAARLAITEQLSRTRTHHQQSMALGAAERELATQRSMVESLQSDDYKVLSDALGAQAKELQNVRAAKTRMERLSGAITAAVEEWRTSGASITQAESPYEGPTHAVINRVLGALADPVWVEAQESAAAREAVLVSSVDALRTKLEGFLKARGLSEENLSDVGRANERMAHLEDAIGTLRAGITVLESDIVAFRSQRAVAENYRSAVEALLVPINTDLRGQGAEVKPIELRYVFDMDAFRRAMIQRVADAIGQIEGRAPRPDYVEMKLEGVDFTALGDRASTVDLVTDEIGVYGRTIREFLNEGINFEILKLESEFAQLDLQTFGRIDVLYDGKPVETSSFGQRCTAVIVVLLLLGNMPIVIDEPEAHLDSSLIAKYLVNLIKAKKQHRQIVFATHNANFVINGDADVVHCLSMDDEKVTRIVSTTIEDLANRELLLALEGGEFAFQQRERRYGID
jgi:DNA repair protein SbcC/Rad50